MALSNAHNSSSKAGYIKRRKTHLLSDTHSPVRVHISPFQFGLHPLPHTDSVGIPLLHSWKKICWSVILAKLQVDFIRGLQWKALFSLSVQTVILTLYVFELPEREHQWSAFHTQVNIDLSVKITANLALEGQTYRSKDSKLLFKSLGSLKEINTLIQQESIKLIKQQ